MKIFHKQGIVISLVLIAIVIAVLLVTVKRTNKIVGNLLEIKENSLFVSGKYINIKTSAPYSDSFTAMEIVFGSDTKITRIGLRLPSQEELKKTNGMFKVDDLKKEETIVDLDTLKKDFSKSAIGLTVTGNSNIFNSKKLKAKEIIYRTPIF